MQQRWSYSLRNLATQSTCSPMRQFKETKEGALKNEKAASLSTTIAL